MRTHPRLILALGLGLSLALPLSCGQNAGNGADVGGGGRADSGNGGDADEQILLPDATPVVPHGDAGYDFDATCAASTVQATLGYQPVDIIIVVDNSKSMQNDIANTTANLNDFATIIEQSGIDYHVVMISAVNDTNTSLPYKMCIPQPLAGPNCGDGPRYHAVDQGIYSTKVLKQIIKTYQGQYLNVSGTYTANASMMWKAYLRVSATKHFLIITDDNATVTQMDAAAFDPALKALDPPMFTGYVFNAICALDAACASVAAGSHIGTEYVTLATNTGGKTASICSTDWKTIFRDLATSVVQSTKLTCDFAIPPPPAGKTIQTSKVSVVYTPGTGGAPVSIKPVDNQAACSAATPGFYFDDNAKPTRIFICPQFCPTLQGDAKGKVDVRFGCINEIT